MLLGHLAGAQNARDSAGIRITTLTPSATVWRLGKIPSLEIRSSEDGVGPVFSHASPVLRTRDGNILFVPMAVPGRTSDGWEIPVPRNRIAVFNGAGKFVRYIGRAGRGPGEFNDIIEVIPFGDSLFIRDYRGEFTIMRLDGTFAHRSLVNLGGHLVGVHGPFADGSFVARTTEAGSGTANFTRISTTGKVLNEIAGPLFAAVVGHTPLWTPYGQYTVRGENLFYSSGSKYEIQAYSPTGNLKEIIRINREPRRSTKADITAFEHEQQMRGNSPPKNAKYSEALPAISALLVDAEGDLWIGEGAPTVNVTHWLLLDKSRRFLASVTTPQNMRVTQVDRSYVLGTCHDPESGDWVCMYRIER
jgi:hypothetical protein